MSTTVLFVLVLAGVVGWWLFARQLTGRPWELAQRKLDDSHEGATLAVSPARTGLWVLLAVISSFFALFMSAYGMRMMLDDWRPLAEPSLLWGNTLILVLSSIAFQWTRVAARRGDRPAVQTGLIVTGFFTFAFLAGQVLAWRQLSASGQYLHSNVANAFFFLLTGLHGLHLLGGLAAWARTMLRLMQAGTALGQARQSVELCATYWHYLLLVWLVLFGMLLAT
ncbi:MAG: cytochrome-c oxidase [Gammaproteobacteria bacterium]|nr:cytochrome-c oxidase [Gammaproteobacteria bacterium]